MSLRSTADELVARALAAGLRGTTFSRSHFSEIESRLGAPLPEWFTQLFCEVPLPTLELGIEDQESVSWLTWSNAENLISESLECYPGLAILPRGYVNVASCLEGSGDPYFVSLSQGPDPCLYRVYHDVGTDADAILRKGLEQVSPSLSSFFANAVIDSA